MKAGKLISDDLTLQIVQERTSRDDCEGTFILDGFPRTQIQAEMLEQLASAQGKQISAIEVDVPREELMKRLTGRRSCSVCGEIYNVYSKPPKNDGVCDFHLDVTLTHRADDNEESASARLAVYEEQTKPLLDYYEQSNRLEEVGGEGDLEEIYAAIEKLI